MRPRSLPLRQIPALLISTLLLATMSAAQQPSAPQRAAFNPSVVLQPFRAGGTYRVGERVGWTLYAPLGGVQRFAYTMRENNAVEVKGGTIDLTSGTATIETSLAHPAMLYVRLTPIGGDGRPIDTSGFGAADLNRLTVGAAIAPERLKPARARPADFDRFWAAQLAKLRRVPVNAKSEPVPTSQPGVDVQTITLDSVGGHVHGYLAKPARPGRYPALLLLQWAGVYPLQPDWVTARAAEGWLTFDVDAHDMAPTEATAPTNYPAVGAESRDTSYFLGMYLRDTRALDWLRSRPDWDGRTVVLMGSSMGGQQSFVTAGLNPGKVTAIVVNVPAGADVSSDGNGRRSGYPNWNTADSRVARTAPYFDPVNFASRIDAPTLAGIGFIDTTSPPAGIFTVLNQIRAPTEAVSMLDSDHNNISPQQEGAYYRRAREVLEELRSSGSFKPASNWANGDGGTR